MNDEEERFRRFDRSNVMEELGGAGGTVLPRKPREATVTRFPVASRIAQRDGSARAFYLDIVLRFEAVAKRADLSDPKEFHDLLWLAVQLGASQTSIAYDQAKAPSMVSRWISGEQTPMLHRRQGILGSALIALRQAIDDGSVVPMRSYFGRRSKRTLPPLSG